MECTSENFSLNQGHDKGNLHNKVRGASTMNQGHDKGHLQNKVRGNIKKAYPSLPLNDR